LLAMQIAVLPMRRGIGAGANAAAEAQRDRATLFFSMPVIVVVQ